MVSLSWGWEHFYSVQSAFLSNPRFNASLFIRFSIERFGRDGWESWVSAEEQLVLFQRTWFGFPTPLGVAHNCLWHWLSGTWHPLLSSVGTPTQFYKSTMHLNKNKLFTKEVCALVVTWCCTLSKYWASNGCHEDISDCPKLLAKN